MTDSKFNPIQVEFLYNSTFNERELRLFFSSHGEAMDADIIFEKVFGDSIPDCILKNGKRIHSCNLTFNLDKAILIAENVTYANLQLNAFLSNNVDAKFILTYWYFQDGDKFPAERSPKPEGTLRGELNRSLNSFRIDN